MTTTIIATVAAILTGIALKTFEAFLARLNKRKEAQRLHDQEIHATRQQVIADLRLDLQNLEKKYADVVEEFEEWKDKYWALREQHVDRLAQLTEALNKLKDSENDSSTRPA